MSKEKFHVDPYEESKAKLPEDVLKELPKEDSRPAWKRLLSSLKIKIFGIPPTGGEITGGIDF